MTPSDSPRPAILARWRFWRYLPLRAQVCMGFVLPLVVVTGLSWLVERAVDETNAHTRQTETSLRAVVVFGQLLQAVLNAETGERGFVITGDTAFLAPYESARTDFEEAAREWRSLVDAGGDANLERTELLFERWRSEVAEPAIAARRQSPSGHFELALQATRELAELAQALQMQPPAQLQRVEVLRYETALQAAAQLGSDTPAAKQWLAVEESAQRLRPLLALFTENPRLSTRSSERQQALDLAHLLVSQLLRLSHSAGDGQERARQIIASGNGKQLMDQIRALVAQSLAQQEQYNAVLAADLGERMQTMRYLAVMLPLPGLGLGLGLLLLMQLDLIASIQKLRAATRQIKTGDLTARIMDDRTDELGALGGGFNRMAEGLERAEREASLLDGLQSMLISSNTEEEIYAAAARALEKLLPRVQGSLYLLAASRDFAERKVTWNGGDRTSERLHPEGCRALRLGRSHTVGSESAELLCPHLSEQNPPAAVCIPLITRDEVLGTLVLLPLADSETSIEAHDHALGCNLAERLALALSNQRLTEKLRRESVRDPLTGLFNRRYLEETFTRELARVKRIGQPLAVLAVDVDHFKRFNDTFGHDAGDHVLREVAARMLTVVRSSDIACRFGGEEFVLILPEATAQVALQRAEQLRLQVAGLHLHWGGRDLGTSTVSLGVAVFPNHGQGKDELLRIADNALYTAKRQGRNRVVLAGTDPTPTA